MIHTAQRSTRKRIAAATGAVALAASALTAGLVGFGAGPATAGDNHGGTATPIKHVVVILQENVSFDHYFATCWWSFHEFVLPFEDVTLLSAAPSRSWVGPPSASGRSHGHSQPGGVCQGHVGGVPFMMLVFASSLSLLSGLCFPAGLVPGTRKVGASGTLSVKARRTVC